MTMVVWVGGLIFFAFVEAPTAFHVMGTNRQFAQLIGDSISTLNRLGHVSGFIFLIATAMVWLRARRRGRGLLIAQIVLVVTASSHRVAAFEAATFLMDYLKTRAPFWKKEHHKDGTSGEWVAAIEADDVAAGRWGT